MACCRASRWNNLNLLAAGVLKDVMGQPAAAEAVKGWAPGSAVMAVRVTS